VPHPVFRALAVATSLALATIALSGCTTTSPKPAVDDCAGIISKVLLTDDSGTSVAKFSAGDVPAIFNIPGTPAPTCYYSSIAPPSSSSGGTGSVDTHRTLLYLGLSDSQTAALIASIRKTVSVKPWTVRFDYDLPPATPAAGATATPTTPASTTTSARWYYNFTGAASEDKGELGYYKSTPISQGTALQAGLSKPVNVLRIETELQQVKK
jgi:hypothetical protein